MGVDTKHRNDGFLALSGRCTVTSLTTAHSQKRTLDFVREHLNADIGTVVSTSEIFVIRVYENLLFT